MSRSLGLPRIATDDQTIGFHWLWPDGRPAALVDLFDLPDAEPHRWVPTHLEALDEMLIEIAASFGDLLGGGRRPQPAEHDEVVAAFGAIDRACAEYASAQPSSGVGVDLRAGQIVGTAALFSIRLRESLGLIGAAPLDGELDVPTPGPVGGQARLEWVQEGRPERGARWVVHTLTGQRWPATLSMLLFDSSGVLKEATLDEHRAALRRVCEAVESADNASEACAAVEWLLFDWLMAHRGSGSDSGAVEITSRRIEDAQLIIDATRASLRLRYPRRQ